VNFPRPGIHNNFHSGRDFRRALIAC
jgi:hypothetical protein